MIIGNSIIKISETQKARGAYRNITNYGIDKSNKDVQMVQINSDDMHYT